MSSLGTLAAPLALVLLIGCGSDTLVQEIESLRKSGRAKDGRDKALEALSENPSRKKVWLEFVRCTIEQARGAERSGEDPFPFVTQAAVACVSVYRKEKQKPSQDWKVASTTTATELTRQANQIMTTMHTQVRAAEYAEQMRQRTKTGLQVTMEALQSMDKVDGFRRDGRELLYRETAIEILLAALPELSEGTTATLTNQLSLTRTEWIQTLELGPDYTQPIIARSQQQVNAALDKATDDMKELGYFLVESIVDNGIL